MINFVKVKLEDAEALWHMMNNLDYETKYMLFEAGERKKDFSIIKSRIENVLKYNDFLCLAKDGDKIAGYISAEKGKLKRIEHTAYIVVGVLKEYTDKKIGSEFFKRLDLWAKENHIKRLELTVVCENDIAKHLYEKNGFKIEGIKKKSMYIDKKYVDEYYMAKIFE